MSVYKYINRGSNIPGAVREGQSEGKSLAFKGTRRWIQGTLPPFHVQNIFEPQRASGHTHLLGIATEELVQKLR